MHTRRTKIVCTIGPSSNSRKMLERLIQAGMDVARLNFSHGTHAQHEQVLLDLKDLSVRCGRPIAVLQDLSGPKMRLGDIALGGITLRRGDMVGLISEAGRLTRTEQNLLPVPIPELLDDLKPNKKLLIDDGKMALTVVRCEGAAGSPDRVVWARSSTAGRITSRKGISAPGTRISIPAVTEKDLEDLRFGLQMGVDWVAVSFIRAVHDLDPIYELMSTMNKSAPIIAKIERAEAVLNFASIQKRVDGVMVARGDLGVEMDFDEVPIVQKKLIRECNRLAMPVITATQMLESMLSCPRPTRAEEADVANAIFDGTDAIMLSGETASGQYPVEAVRTMARIAKSAERAFFETDSYSARLSSPTNITAAVGGAGAHIAKEVGARAIICATSTGSTARQVASHRPAVPILAATNVPATRRRLCLSWGVESVLVETVQDSDSMMRATLESALQSRHIKNGDRVVLTAGVPVNHPGTTNFIRVHTVGSPL